MVPAGQIIALRQIDLSGSQGVPDWIFWLVHLPPVKSASGYFKLLDTRVTTLVPFDPHTPDTQAQEAGKTATAL